MKKWMFFLFLMFCCSGCSADMTEKSQQQAHFVKASLEIGDRTPEERVLVLKNRLKQIDGIIGTGVVVEGHTAIIGLRLEEGMGQDEISNIKRKVEAAVKGAEVAIENTSVTTNTYIVSMIEEMERSRAG